MRSTIADIVNIVIVLFCGLIATKSGVDVTGYVVGILVGSFAAGFSFGIKGKGNP